MSQWKAFLDEQLSDPEFKKEWDLLEDEFIEAQAIIERNAMPDPLPLAQ